MVWFRSMIFSFLEEFPEAREVSISHDQAIVHMTINALSSFRIRQSIVQVWQSKGRCSRRHRHASGSPIVCDNTDNKN